jgi:hypothetical protein
MSTPEKSHFTTGLLAGLLPLVIQPLMGIALLFQLGGTEGLARAVASAGVGFYIVAGVSLVFTPLLAAVLLLVGRGNEVPLAVPAVLALVPWWAGITGSLMGARTVLEVVVMVNPMDLFPILMVGTGEIIIAQQMGAWSSAGLLLATAGGLVIAAVGPAASRQEPTRSAPSGRMLEAVAALLLGLVAVLSASESSAISETLMAAGNVDAADLSLILANGLNHVQGALRLRTGALAALAVIALLLVGWRLRPAVLRVGAVVALVPLGLAAAGTLWAHGQPAVRMGRAMEPAARQASPVPEELQLMPLGVDRPFERLELVALHGGLSQPKGASMRLGQSDERLLEFLAEVTGNLPGQRRRPQQTLSLAVDGRMPVEQVRRLLTASQHVGLTTLYLLAAPGPGAEASREPWDEDHQHFLMWVAGSLRSRPGFAEVLLPPALESGELTYDSIWAGQLDHQPRVQLSRLTKRQDGSAETRVLELKGPTEPSPPRVAGTALLYLTVTPFTSTESVAHAVRVARAQGFRVLLSSTLPPADQAP